MMYHLKFSLCAGAAGASPSAASTVPASKAGVSSAFVARFCSKSLVCSPGFNSSAIVLLSVRRPIVVARSVSMLRSRCLLRLMLGEMQEELIDALAKDQINDLE